MYQAGYCSGVCRRGEHFYLGKALRGGCLPGATDGSIPVDSAETIYTFIVVLIGIFLFRLDISSLYIGSAFLNLLFSNAVLIPPPDTHSARMSLQFVLYSRHSGTAIPRSQHRHRVSHQWTRTRAPIEWTAVDLAFPVLMRGEFVAGGHPTLHHILPEARWLRYSLSGPEHLQGPKATFWKELWTVRGATMLPSRKQRSIMSWVFCRLALSNCGQVRTIQDRVKRKLRTESAFWAS